MTAEQTLFLALLRDHVHGTASAVPPPETDWEALLDIAKAQCLAGVCYVQLRSLPGIPSETLRLFHGRFLNDVFFAANRRAELERVSRELNAQGVPILLFKGCVVKETWPVPELRTMGDIDVLIRAEDREKSDRAMESLGYKSFKDHHAVWTYFKDQIEFELHDHMFYEHLSSQVDYQGYFDRAWDFTSPDLDASFHLLYLLAHLAKHLTNRGMGFRSFLDLVFWCRAKEAELRWDWIYGELETLGLLRFAETAFAFCRDWFQVSTPLSGGELTPAFFCLTTDKVFEDGIFGLENKQNEIAGSAKEIAHSKTPYWLGALHLSLKRLFPSYRDMQLVPWYNFVDGRPWLLPAAWVYRWFYCLANKSAHSRALLAQPISQRTQIDRRIKQISEWGL